MDGVVRKYLREELTDQNAVKRATRRHLETQCYRFLEIESERPNVRADGWPELLNGNVENAVNLKFMHALRSGSEERAALVATSARTTTSRAFSGSRVKKARSSPQRSVSPAQCLLVAHTRPVWNADTKHLDRGVDPLQKCLADALNKRGFGENYTVAKRTLDAVHAAEVARLKQSLAQRKILLQQQDALRELQVQMDEALLDERQKRDVITRGERTIRSRILKEFCSTMTLAMELSEFNARKKIFRTFLQQLDELKIMEREEHVEQKLFEKMAKQRELELKQKQREADLRKRRAEEARHLFYGLITDEIRQRESIFQSSSLKLGKIHREENAARDGLLQIEIIESILTEEMLQRQLVVELRYAEFTRFSEVFLVQAREISAREQERLERERADRLQRDHLQRLLTIEEAQRDLIRFESINRSDVTGAAIQSFSSEMIRFHATSQQIRLLEREQRLRGDICENALDERNVLLRNEQRERGMATENSAARQRLQRKAKDEAELQAKHGRERWEHERAEKRAREETERMLTHEVEQILKQEFSQRVKIEAKLSAQQEVARKAEDDAKQRRAAEEAASAALLQAEAVRVAELRNKAVRTNKPFLGVTLAEHVDPPALVVDSLYVDGPAEAAGLRLGDVLVQVELVPVTSFAEMRDAVRHHAKMGEHLTLYVLRRIEGTPSPSVPGSHSALDNSTLGTMQQVITFVKVLTADKEFAELTDLYFDVESHARISISRATSAAGTPSAVAVESNIPSAQSSPVRSLIPPTPPSFQ